MSYYKVPFYLKARIKWYAIIFYVFALVICVAFAGLYFYFGIQQRPLSDTLFALFFVVVGLYLIYILGGLLFGRFFIELTPTMMNISVPFKKFNVNWDQVSKAKIVYKYARIYIGVLLKGDSGDYSFLIPLTYFMDVEVESLLNTFKKMIKNKKNDPKTKE